MAYEEKYRISDGMKHSVSCEGRSRVSVTGVSDVESFDENEVVMATVQGLLLVHGSELKIDRLSLETGDVTLGGTIDRLIYEDDATESGGLFSRLFK